MYRRLEDADEIHREMLDREREQAQTVAAAAVGKDLPAAEDIEVVFAEYTHLYALTCGVVGCAERAAGVPFSVPGVGAAA